MQNRIRSLREEYHMSQVRLSIELGVSQETVSAYEKGKHYPSVAILLHLAQIFHASCDYILGMSDMRTPCKPDCLGNEEQRLLDQYHQLPAHKQALLLAYLDGLIATK